MDGRIRIIYHEQKRAATAAKNTGLNHNSGEWFTVLDSNDEMLPKALETIIRIPLEADKTLVPLTAIV